MKNRVFGWHGAIVGQGQGSESSNNKLFFIEMIPRLKREFCLKIENDQFKVQLNSI